MGVADKQTYRNQYHFTDVFNKAKDEHVSLEGGDKINQTIKENPYRSNVEIEGGEVVLQPDLTALFKAQGKKHSRGGMDVMLKPDSFVFSDYKYLALDENDHKLFELKEGGNFKPEKNTPAQVLKRNVNVKHYNTLSNTIQDTKADDLAKKSSAMMLEKYISTLGNIAFIQEQKKNFPDGVPAFAQNTAPVYDNDLKQDVMESKQYAKYGGAINNPYAKGGPAPCPCGKDADGNCLPCTDDVYQAIMAKARKENVAPSGYNRLYDNQQATLYGKFGKDPKSFNVPGAVPGGNPNGGWAKKIQGMIDQGATLDDLVKQGHGTRLGLSKMFKFPLPGTPDDYAYVPKAADTPPANPPAVVPPVIPPTDNIPQVNGVNGNKMNGVNIDWQFTPWQKLSQAYNWSQAANVKRYMPYRSHFNATYAEPSLLNPEQAVGDAKASTNQQISALSTLNPILRNAQAAAAQGNALNSIPGIRSQYDNQNAQITNQFRQFNNQTRNNESMVNMQNDQQYYQQAIQGRQNFDNMRQYLSNQAMNNVMGDVQTNQALAYELATQKNPAFGFDFKTGNFSRNSKNILDVQTDAKSDLYTQLANNLMSKINSGQKLTKEEVDFFKGLSVGKLQFSQQKMGGKIKKNPYK